mmetsp:Transcript_39608/g.64465  ORF Transcript_39608/g.64465 Transcript_39608/m.64465 type:complete len:298 (-) Transcript_39608:118-1011(-)
MMPSPPPLVHLGCSLCPIIIIIIIIIRIVTLSLPASVVITAWLEPGQCFTLVRPARNTLRLGDVSILVLLERLGIPQHLTVIPSAIRVIFVDGPDVDNLAGVGIFFSLKVHLGAMTWPPFPTVLHAALQYDIIRCFELVIIDNDGADWMLPLADTKFGGVRRQPERQPAVGPRLRITDWASVSMVLYPRHDSSDFRSEVLHLFPWRRGGVLPEDIALILEGGAVALVEVNKLIAELRQHIDGVVRGGLEPLEILLLQLWQLRIGGGVEVERGVGVQHQLAALIVVLLPSPFLLRPLR